MIYSIIAALQVAGLSLVYQSKHVASIPSLNEAKFVIALIYTSTVYFCIVAITKFMPINNLDASNAVTSVMGLVLIFAFLGLVFGPKVRKELIMITISSTF